MQSTPSPTVAIVGAGMSGLCMAAKLKRAGVDTFTVFEKADALGGTWRDNTYPGLACDVPSRFYQFSFDPNPDWSHFFSPGGEINAYFEAFADRHGLRDHIAFGTEIVAAEFDDSRWHLTQADGATTTADFLVSCCGILHRPRNPDIEGLDTFAGPVMHSARWDHDVRTADRRVGIVGTGSTGVQLVCGLAGNAEHVSLFQRSAQWILPLPNPAYSTTIKRLHRHIPVLDRIAYATTRKGFEVWARALIRPGLRRRATAAVCRANLRTVRDPALREALTPDYQPMCRRLVVSSGFYRAIQRDDVTLVADGIDRVVPAGVVTGDGVLHELDVLVLATGFDAHAYMRPMTLVGPNGATLDDAWRDGPRAFQTVAVPGFPNFFMLMGPHSPVGNYALTAIAETQSEHVMHWVKEWRAGRIAHVAPTAAATDRFNEDMRAAMPGTVWTTGCTSWYLGADGVPELWPWTPDRHRDLLAAIDTTAFEVAA